MTNVSQNDGHREALYANNDASNLDKSDIKVDKTQQIKRGFSNKNSSSSVNEKNILTNNKVNRPVIDAPKIDPAVENKAMEEVMSMFSSVEQGKKNTTADFLNKINKDYVEGKMHVKESDSLLKNSLNILNNKENKNPQNEKLLDSAKTIGEKLKNNLDKNNNVISENKQQSKSLSDVSNLFHNTVALIPAIKRLPDDVKKDLANDLDVLAKNIANKKELDVDTALIILNKVTDKLAENRIALEKNDIRFRQTQKERHASEEMKKILESIEKAKESEKSGVFGKILGYVGAALMVVTSAFMIMGAVFTGGATAIVAAALIVTATSLMITMQVSQETGGWLTKMAGEDNEFAMQMVLLAVIVVLSVGAGAASAGVGTAGNAANAAAKLAKWQSVASKLTKASTIAGSVSQAGSASANMIAADAKYDADILTADALKMRAKWLYEQIMIDENRSRFEELVQDFIGGDSIKQKIAEIMKDSQASKVKLARNFT